MTINFSAKYCHFEKLIVIMFFVSSFCFIFFVCLFFSCFFVFFSRLDVFELLSLGYETKFFSRGLACESDEERALDVCNRASNWANVAHALSNGAKAFVQFLINPATGLFFFHFSFFFPFFFSRPSFFLTFLSFAIFLVLDTLL